jgi:hypothetical protein
MPLKEWRKYLPDGFELIVRRHTRLGRLVDFSVVLLYDGSLGAHIAQINWQTSTAGVEVMDSTLKPRSSPRSNSRYNVGCVDPDRSVAGDTFDAMGMQRVPVREAFYEARIIGNRGVDAHDAKVRRLIRVVFSRKHRLKARCFEDFPLASRVRVTSQPDGRKPEPHFRRPE